MPGRPLYYFYSSETKGKNKYGKGGLVGDEKICEILCRNAFHKKLLR